MTLFRKERFPRPNTYIGLCPAGSRGDTLRETPTQTSPSTPTLLTAGYYRHSDGRIDYNNGEGHYCHVYTWEDFISFGGHPDLR